MDPVRIQRKRTKGFDLQAESLARNGLPCAYVGRPTKYGNPWTVDNVFRLKPNGRGGVESAGKSTPELCVQLYREDILNGSIGMSVEEIRRTLRGKNLACWCKEGGVCHADVLLELANR